MSVFRCQDLEPRFPDTRNLNSISCAIAAPDGPLLPNAASKKAQSIAVYTDLSAIDTDRDSGLPDTVNIPLKHPVRGMKVRFDGRTFIIYAQFKSGVVVPHRVAKQVNLPQRVYVARNSMICKFC